ncbi:hypothetical protein J6590_040950 [Homalodisca vitripennis]|nr:hypothetical protein J6590_040950 [Homalodisca vitripennis]
MLSINHLAVTKGARYPGPLRPSDTILCPGVYPEWCPYRTRGGLAWNGVVSLG